MGCNLILNKLFANRHLFPLQFGVNFKESGKNSNLPTVTCNNRFGHYFKEVMCEFSPNSHEILGVILKK